VGYMWWYLAPCSKGLTMVLTTWSDGDAGVQEDDGSASILLLGALRDRTDCSRPGQEGTTNLP